MDSISTKLAMGLMWLPLLIIAMQLSDGISRNLFNAPFSWTLELTMFIFAGYMFLVSGYTMIHEQHVRMDIFYSRWSPKKKAIFDVATFPLAAVLFITVIIGGINSVEYTVRTGQHTATSWGPILAPINIVFLVASIIFFLQIIAFLIRDVYTIMGRPLK